MDRKAWIVVSLCVIGMAVNAYFSAQNVKLRPPRKPEISAPVGAAPAPVLAPPTSAKTEPEVSAAQARAQKRTITNGTVTYDFTSLGGGIATATLRSKGEIVLNKYGSAPIGAFQPGAKLTDELQYNILEATEKKVVFEGQMKDGLVVRKTYSVMEGPKSDEHLLALTLTLTNKGQAPIASSQYFLNAGAAASMRPDDIQHPSFFWNHAGNADHRDTTWFGAGWFTKNPLEIQQTYSNLRWAGVMSRFYAHIISTKEGVENQPGQVAGERFLVDHHADEFGGTAAGAKDYAIRGAVGLPPIELAPGASKTLDYELYLGPKEYHRLANIERERTYVMFYGTFSFISRIFINLLSWLHTQIGSWGWAVVILTIIVRLFLWPFHAKSQKAMKRMAKLSPMMKDIQEKYKDDPARQSQETMKLYRDYGVSPLGGCLPLFFQIPIFFGFFAMLGSAAELRGESFLWVKDLASPDTIAHLFGFPINPLPVLMGISMFLQMRLTPQPATMDKMQQRIMMFMPFMFLTFCYSYAAALALYWTTQNIFSILQSRIMRMMGDDDDAPLQKVQRAPVGPAPSSPFALPGQNQKDKKKLAAPRLGGGGTSSKGKKRL